MPSTPRYAVVVEDLVKRYGGKEAVRGISFRVERGSVYALIGPNGAGKTTTLRILATLLRPTGGRALVDGKDVVREALEVRRVISYLPEEAGAYPNMTGLEYLEFIAKVYFDDPREAREAVERGADISGLGDALGERVKTYSKGMKRRLQLARALMTMPRVLILDEPTSGVDVFHALHLRRLIRRAVEEWGSTVVLSSHNMLEVETISDRVAFIHGGRIVAEGAPSEVKRMYNALDLEDAFVKAVSPGGVVGGL